MLNECKYYYLLPRGWITITETHGCYWQSQGLYSDILAPGSEIFIPYWTEWLSEIAGRREAFTHILVVWCGCGIREEVKLSGLACSLDFFINQWRFFGCNHSNFFCWLKWKVADWQDWWWLVGSQDWQKCRRLQKQGPSHSLLAVRARLGWDH